MRNATRLGTIFGIELRLDYSWCIVFILGIWSLARYYLPGVHLGWSPTTYWVGGVLTSVVFFASVVVHELAHTLVARIYQAPAYGSTLFIFGGGTHIGQEPRKPHEEVLIALAGPGMSFVLATLFYSLWRLSAGSDGLLHALAGWLAWLNLMLALLNLIPAFPLDGGRVLRAVVWDGAGNLRRATTIAIAVGHLVALGFIFYGSWLGFWQIRSGTWGEGLWIALVGWLLNRAVTQSEQQLELHDRQLLSGHTAREAMLTDCPRIFGRVTLDVLVDQMVRSGRHPYFLVVTGNQLQGLLSLAHIQAVPRKRWPMTHVEDVMLPLSQLETVRPGVTLTTVLEYMTAEPERLFVVIDDERPLGIILRDTLSSFLHMQAGRPYRLLYAHS
jgi:Zn-dependent protease